jgi:hypothetical protein
MGPSRCVYCGSLAENPAHLRWVAPGVKDQATVPVTLRLCQGCANSWCRTEREEPARRMNPVPTAPESCWTGSQPAI